MCFTPEEKKEIFSRIRHVEGKTDEHETTMKVALYVASGFMTLILLVAAWYLSEREQQTTEMAASLQFMSVSLAELNVTMQFYADSFANHVSSPNNHPDNTARVDRLIEDLRELHEEVEDHFH